MRPSPFSPNADGVRDATELSFIPRADSAFVTASVEVFRVADETPWGMLLPPSSVSRDASLALDWAPVGIADGAYRFDVLVTQGADSVRASAFVTSDTGSPSVQLGALTPNPFNPDAPPPNHRLDIPFTVVTSDSTTQTSVVVRRNGALVDSVASLAGPGAFAVKWDGLDADSAAAPSGVYQAVAEARDGAGNAASSTASFTLDRTSPSFVLADSLLTSSFPLEVRGRAIDHDRVVSVRYRIEPDTTTFAVDSLGAPADTVGFLALVDLGTPQTGFHVVTFRAADEAGRVSEKSVQIGYDTVIPVVVSSTLVDGPGPYGAHDVVRIRSIWNSSELRVTGIFSDLDSQWLPNRETVVNEGSGSYLVSYELSRSNTRTAGAHAVRIRASTGLQSPIAAADTVMVLLAPAVELSEIGVNRNRIDPSRQERVTIASPEGNDAIEVEIYNLAGARVRTLEGTGEVVWDGKSEAGAVCASGTYWLRIQAGSGEDVRRVVVWSGE